MPCGSHTQTPPGSTECSVNGCILSSPGEPSINLSDLGRYVFNYNYNDDSDSDSDCDCACACDSDYVYLMKAITKHESKCNTEDQSIFRLTKFSALHMYGPALHGNHAYYVHPCVPISEGPCASLKQPTFACRKNIVTGEIEDLGRVQGWLRQGHRR